MIRLKLNRLATTLRTLSTTTTTTVRTTPSLATTNRHSLIQTASYKTKYDSYNEWSTESKYDSYNEWSTESKWLSTGKLNYIGQGFEYLNKNEPLNDVVQSDNIPNDVVLYQLEGCPLCNMVKVFLEYYGIPHKIMEVNPFYEWENERSDFRKVPVLMVDGEKLVNASEIIDEMFKRMHPDSVAVDVETQKWRGWADTVLLTVLALNRFGSLSGALETHDYVWSNGCYEDAQRFALKYCGAFHSYFLIKKFKIRHFFGLKQMRKELNVADDREFLYKAAEEWVDALNGKRYLGGTEPNLGDLAVFGVLRPMQNLKFGKDLVENTRIGEWFTRMEKEMKPDCVKSCTLFIS